jgi:hypothetical protein
MKTKAIFFGVALTVGSFVTSVSAQDDEVRGAFMTTRPKASSKPKTGTTGTTAKQSRRRPKPTPGDKVTVTPSDPNPASKVVPQRIGLGLTLFLRDSNGMAVRTDPAHEFTKGDRVRVLLETNADGYLYIFNTTNGGQPVMIYPDPELDEAGNYLQAHVPFEIPSSTAGEERLRWFAFDQNAGTEKLYFVFTREPLTGVPIEDDLIAFCRDNKTKCPWQPSGDTWMDIQAELKSPMRVAKTGASGRAQTSAEQDAVNRGIGLNRDDPEPSLIMLTSSTEKKILIATLELLHKTAGD